MNKELIIKYTVIINDEPNMMRKLVKISKKILCLHAPKKRICLYLKTNIAMFYH